MAGGVIIAAVLAMQGAVDTVVYFGPGSAALDDRARAVLEQRLIAAPVPRDTPLMIEGHGDARERRSDSYRLSLRRAEAVRDFLVAGGFAPAGLSVIGHDDTRPAAYDSGPSVEMFNRRAVVTRRD